MKNYDLSAKYPFGGSLQPGYYQKNYKIATISWEKARTWGVGFDATLLDKVTVAFDYYDRKNTLLKTYTATGFQKVQGNWRPALMLMVNAQNRKQTRLEWSEFKFKTGLKKDDFTENALKRAR